MNRLRPFRPLGFLLLLILLLAGPVRAGPPPAFDQAPTTAEASGPSHPHAEWVLAGLAQSKTFDLIGTRSLALDSADHPHIAYGGDGLYYAWHDGATWHLEVADATEGLGQYTSLQIDALDRRHISYYDEDNFDLRYAFYDGTTWQVTVVDSGAGSC